MCLVLACCSYIMVEIFDTGLGMEMEELLMAGQLCVGYEGRGRIEKAARERS